MKKSILFLLGLFMGISGILAQGFPAISTDENTKWYLIQFMNGGNAITAENSGAQITTSAALGSDAQLWKITGDATSGYTFTNKKGYTLYVNSAAKNQMVYANTNASGVSKFFINATSNGSYSGGYEIQPKGNTNVSMNLWGGPAENRGVGLWDKSDQNNPVEFVETTVFENIGKISIIPQPLNMTVGEGTIDFTKFTAIAYKGEQLKEHVEAFAAQLNTSAGISLEVKEAGATAADGEIWFGTDATLPAEGYTLTTSEKQIVIKASEFGGHLYGLQTLMQLLPREFFASERQNDVEWTVPAIEINDKPLLGHRGYMLDIARHFFNKDEVKKVLDIMVLYKMNRFHWHLTDDQGWRVEIPEYPKLTEIGAIRKASFSNADGQNFYDDTEYGRGMYYTLNDLKEIVDYAKARNIEIIPEIDLPGHMVAAVASYPEFSCDPTKQYEVRVDGGISHDVLNIGNEEVITFLKCVLGHIAETFPYDYVHIGGDECPTEQWANNQQCLALVQKLGLAGVHQLQSWLVEELGIFLKENYNKDIIVWDELLANWNDNNKTKPVIMAWNLGNKEKNAAERGMKSIICPYSHLYLDFPQANDNQRPVDEPYNGGWGVNTLDEIYSLNPLGALGGKEEFAIGVQGNMWTETTNDIDEVEYQLLPRMFALAEIGWLPNNKKNWTSFYHRLQSHDEILDYLDYTYAKYFIEPTEYTAEESAVMEAEDILAKSIRGGVGYPAAEVYDALQAALDGDNTTALQQAIANYKNAAITQPVEGKTYQIVSACTYFRQQYEGSTMYMKNNGVRFHYTPQTEPEELWQFVATDGGYVMKNLYNGNVLQMPGYNQKVSMVENGGTAVRIDKATVATGDFTYIPGVVTISAVSGYSASVTGNVKRLSAQISGDVYAKDDAALCYNGTWKIVEVSDFTAQLAGLVKKCELIIITTKPGEIGQPSQEALEYLQNSVINPASQAVADGGVTEEQYNAYVALYHQFQMMPRTSMADALDFGAYYYIRNGYFTDKYAALNRSTRKVEPKSKGTADDFLWSFTKNVDGTVRIYNKANGEAAYINSAADDQTVYVGQDYDWALVETTTDQGNKGIGIVSANGSSAWYINPSAWSYVLTKPYTWGGSVWTFEKSNVQIETGITEVKDESGNVKGIFDLSGRRVENPTAGIYIVDGNKVLVK
ncbi:MAG: family 20 glycosylhydrolase [Bacteroidaceae bacterium]|nr:family 20 glycosylhydrolase [Bacteroidaceae bacterium]